jgi:hypothetical protein
VDLFTILTKITQFLVALARLLSEVARLGRLWPPGRISWLGGLQTHVALGVTAIAVMGLAAVWSNSSLSEQAAVAITSVIFISLGLLFLSLTKRQDRNPPAIPDYLRASRRAPHKTTLQAGDFAKGEIVEVTCDRVPLRDGPSSSVAMLALLDVHTYLEVTDDRLVHDFLPQGSGVLPMFVQVRSIGIAPVRGWVDAQFVASRGMPAGLTPVRG